MIVSDITPLRLVTVLERGIPNKECIAIRADDPVNMGQYGIMLGFNSYSGGALPLQDHLFWFGDGVVEAGDWIYVYTCAGKPIKTKSMDESCNIYVVHWGKPTTVFANSNIVPILFRIDAVEVGTTPQDMPQLTG